MEYMQVPSIVLAFSVLCGVAYLGVLQFSKWRRAKAAGIFRNTILDQFNGLYPLPTRWPNDPDTIASILRVKYPALANAVREFSSSVKYKKGFQAAWDNYRHGNSDKEEDYQQYTGPFFETSSPDPKDVFKNNVDRLIAYCDKT